MVELLSLYLGYARKYRRINSQLGIPWPSGYDKCIEQCYYQYVVAPDDCTFQNNGYFEIE